MSITLAADDLCLTQSAVSRQVQALEEMLGVKLLVRGHRSIALTDEGERLFRGADSAVQQLQDIIGALQPAGERRPVTMTTSIGVAGLWLLPRLGRLQQSIPGVEVRVAASNRRVDLKNENIDLAIRYCTPSDAPEGALRLFGETLAPIAHPLLGVASLETAQSLAGHCLLEFDDPRRPWLQWSCWFAAMGWEPVQPRGILRFNQYDQLIHAAIAGQGIALGRIELIGNMLADRRLVVLPPARHSPAGEYAYWLIQAAPQPRQEVRDVVEWIKAEAGQETLSHSPHAYEQAENLV